MWLRVFVGSGYAVNSQPPIEIPHLTLKEMKLLVGSGYTVKSSCWQWLRGHDRKLVMLSREKHRCEKCSQAGKVLPECCTPKATKVDLNLSKPFPSVVLNWIHFLGLLGFLYKQRVLKEIGSLVDLEKPLTSQVLVNGRVQRVEFKSLSTVYFSCGWYGHLKGLCPSVVADQNSARNKVTDFGQTTKNPVSGEKREGTRFDILALMEKETAGVKDYGSNIPETRSNYWS
ncbi:hypothetical protein GOBAR_DD24739 [Gossypium barbadense]|nr:hypothetical protein GOBAR_DD24739 [Gossypium barbadense]